MHMKLNFKRLMAMFLSIMMVVGMMPTMVFAEDISLGGDIDLGTGSTDSSGTGETTDPDTVFTVTLSAFQTESCSTLQEALNAFDLWAANMGILGYPVITLNSDYVITEAVTVDADYPITIDLNGHTLTGEIKLEEGATLTVPQTDTLTVTADGEGTVEYNAESGTYTVVATLAVTYVAKIGETGYETFDAALAAAAAATGDVTVEIYDKVTLSTCLSGSYDSITFVGKDTDAEIYLDVQGYITASGKKVAFEDLTLSKSEGTYITNAGFMNVAFGVYDVVEVTYTNCTFANGAYASSGDVTFTGCTFYRSYDKYGLWAYGNVDVTVDDCTFADYRGIKMYAEGAAKTVDLTVKNTDFSAVTDKPAIVLTYGESVTLSGNTYSETGVFELDLDGAPNGTAVTSTDVITAKNDNGACGVLVDGKIYTTVAQAAEVATSGSTVTLLHNSTETVELAEGVTLDKNGYTADGVTVKVTAPKVPAGTLGVMYVEQTDTGRARMFGEAAGIYANESVVVKFYCNGTLVGTTTRKGVTFPYETDGLTINSVIYGEASGSWDSVWENGALKANMLPDKAELVIDGQVKATVDVVLNGTDGQKKVVAAVTDADGNINSFISNSDFSSDFTAVLQTAFENGGNIVLLRDIAVDTGTITVPDDVSVNFDMNGHKITVTDNATTNYELFYIYGEMTITGNGTIELTSTNNREWNAMSAIFHNRGGVLTIENGTYKNLGGTDMAWVVDNSGNHYGDATTNIKGGTLTSTYTAIRNRMEQNEHGASGKAILNISGGTINGTTSAIWAQAASESTTAPATGEINISGGAIGAINTARSAGAECMTTISGGTVESFKGEVGELTVTSTGTAPASITLLTAEGEAADYVIDENGVYVEAPAVTYVAYIGTQGFETLDAAIAAAVAGKVITVKAGTYAVPSMKAGITIEGETNADGTPAVLLEGTLSGTLENLILKNLHIKGGNAQRWAYAKGNLVFENVIFEATSVYALHFDGITDGTTLLYKDCTIIGWAAMGGSPASCVFDGCTIKDNGTYGVIRTYFDAEIKDCTFDVDSANPDDVYQDGIHAVDGAEVTVNNCTNANGDMADIVNVSGTSVVVLDGVEIKNVAQIDGTYYADIREAFKAATSGCTITLLDDVVFEGNWDDRQTASGMWSKFTVPVTIDGNEKTIKVIGSLSDPNGAFLFKFEADAVVKNLTIDISEVTNSRATAISSKADLTVDNCTFIGNGSSSRGVRFGEGAGSGIGEVDATIKNSTFTNFYRGITDNENGQDAKTVTITGNTLTNAGVAVSAYESVVFTSNTVTEKYVDIRSYTTGNALNVTATDNVLTANTDSKYNYIKAGGTVNAQAEFVVPPKGNVPYAYTSATTIWGETWTNSKESYVIKVVDANGNVMGTSTLNPALYTFTGDTNVTWHITLPGITDNDEWWIQEWTIAPSLTNAPAKVELWADGVKVNEGVIQLNGPDNLNTIYAAVADADGTILSYYTSVAAAGAAATSGQTVQLLRNTTETVELAADVTLDKNGYTADGVTVAAPIYVAQVGETKYTDIQKAIDAAIDGQTVLLLTDDKLETTTTTSDNLAVYLNVAGKSITLDMNGKTISVEHLSTTDRIYAVICVEDGTSLTVTGNGKIDATVDATTPKLAYMFLKLGNGALTVENGTYHMNNSEDSMVYTNTSNVVTVNGGTWTLDAVGTRTNGFPCIFNAKGNNERNIHINGGTYNSDINHQYYAFEADVPETKALKDNGDGTWTVVDAVAYVGEDEGGYIHNVGYATINEALAAAADGETVTLVTDIELAESIKITKNVTLDLNGKAIIGTDNNTSGNFYLFNNVGTLTVKDSVGGGKITLTATTNRAWNASSVVIATNPGGKLVIESGTIEHLGGTDMAYALDNLTNGDTTYAETVINGGTIKSTYRAVRQFLNGNGAQNILTVNGGTIEGTNKSIFFHGPTNKKPCSGTLTVGANAVINGDIYLFVTEGSTEWPVTVSIATAALADGSEVISKNVPASYVVKETNGIWGVEANPSYGKVAQIGETYYESFAAALNEVQNDETITILNVEGSEVGTEIDFTKDIEFTITGNAPNYALPIVTFQNATVNIENATILIPELDARQNATINVIDSTVYDAGGNSIVKSYYNGAINISGTSVVYTMQVTTMGYITISDTAKLNATWQTNVYGNGMITVKEDAQFNTAALQLTGKEYSGRDNTDADRVGQPATIVVDGATFIVGSVKSSNGADYSYNSSSYGVNIGTIEGKSAVLDIKNGATVQILIKNGSAATVGADGTVLVDDSTLGGVNLSGAGTTKFYNTVNFYGDNVVNTTNLGGSPFHLIVNKGATLNITRFVLGYDRAITVYGEIEDAHAFDPTDKTPSLKFNSSSGVSVGGTATGNLTVVDAYIELGNSSWKNAQGTYTWSFENSYVSAASFTNCNAPSSDSASWTVTFDDSVLAAKTYIKNGANTTYNFTNGSVATTGSMRIEGKLYIDATSSVTTTSYQNNKVGADDEHGDITGVIEVDGALTIGSNAALAVELRGGVLKIGANGKVDLTKCPLSIDADSKVIIDATGMVAGDYTNLAGTVENNGTIEVINNNSLTAEVQDGKIVLVKKADVAKIGEQGFTSFAEAIAAAKSGDIIVLLADITEDVTVSKSLTIDGGNFKYTGNISVSGSTSAVTVMNVNFENGTGYAITTNRIKSITVEDCTVKNYGYGFLYANKSTPTVVVKNVTVDGCNYGFHYVYGTSATLENVTMTNVYYGLYIQNYAGKTINLKNCNISSITIWEKATAVQTFKFEGANTVGTLSASQYAKYVLTAADATLTAPESDNYTVTTSVANSMVKYADGKYIVVKAVAKIGDNLYETVADALKAAADGATIELIYAEGDAPIAMNGYVSGKTVTITGTAQVDWEKGFLFVGRTNDGTAAADATLIFENATLTTTQGGDHGIHVSGAEKGKTDKANGTVKMIDSTINLSYLINKDDMTLDNSTLTVKSGFSIGGRPASETVSGEDATATISLTNGSKVVVDNHNGMGLGYEAIGVMNVDATSSFETHKSFLVTAKGTMNLAGTAKVAGTLTNNGSIVLTDAAATLTSSECGKVTTGVDGYEVEYDDGKYALAKVEAPVLSGSIRIKNVTLNLLDKVCIIYKATDDNVATNDTNVVERGILLFDSAEKAASKDIAQAYEMVILEWDENEAKYIGQTEGIDARDMDKSQFAVAYVKMTDGTYIFGTKEGTEQILEYSPLIYCKNMQNSDVVGDLCAAMMHYGAAAQVLQYGKTTGLMNEGFAAVAYDATVLGETVYSANGDPVSGMELKAVTMDLQGAISYIAKYVADDSLEGKKLYAEYTLLGKTGSVELVEGNDGRLWAVINGVAPKDLGATLTVKPYYLNENGQKVYGGELVYSGYEYVRRTLNNTNSSEALKDLCEALAMFIYYADNFGNN